MMKCSISPFQRVGAARPSFCSSSSFSHFFVTGSWSCSEDCSVQSQLQLLNFLHCMCVLVCGCLECDPGTHYFSLPAFFPCWTAQFLLLNLRDVSERMIHKWRTTHHPPNATKPPESYSSFILIFSLSRSLQSELYYPISCLCQKKGAQ